MLDKTLVVSMVVSFGLAGCAPASEAPAGDTEDDLVGAFPVGTSLYTTDDVNLRQGPSMTQPILSVIPSGSLVYSAAATPRANWYGITFNGRTGWVAGAYLSRTPSTATGAPATRILLAHDRGTIVLWDQTFGRSDGADPLANVRAAAAGRAAKTSCYGTAPCSSARLSPSLLSGMATLHEKYGYRYFVTAITGASHSAGSHHYEGRAVDIGVVNGVTIAGDSATARSFMRACRELGASLVLGPSNDSGHQDHIHCEW